MSRKLQIVLVGFLVICMSLSAVVSHAQEQEGEEPSVEEQLSENRRAIQNLFGEIEQITQQIAKQTTLNKDDLNKLEEKVNRLDQSFDKLYNQVNEQSEYMKSLQGVEQYKNKILELAQDVSSLSRKVEKNTSQVKQHEEGFAQVQQIATDLKDIVSANKNRSQANRERIQGLENEMDNLQSQVDSTSRRNLIIGAAGAVLGAVAVVMAMQSS